MSEDTNINREHFPKTDKASPETVEFASLRDKWNAIQEDYLERHGELDMDDLYFEGGGFQGLLEKISKVRGKSVPEIRSEIEKWPT